MSVLAGKDPVKVGCTGVGGFGAVSNIPWIHLDTTHARPNGVMLGVPKVCKSTVTVLPQFAFYKIVPGNRF